MVSSDIKVKKPKGGRVGGYHLLESFLGITITYEHYFFICCLIYVECFSMMIITIAYILMNVYPDSKSSNWWTSTFCVHICFVLFLCFRSIISLSSWLTKICACFGVWLNSFMPCELDKCFYDFIGSWITLFALHEGFWQVSVWLRMKIWDTDILPYFIPDIFFSLRAVTNSAIFLSWKFTYTFTEWLLICLVMQMQNCIF